MAGRPDRRARLRRHPGGGGTEPLPPPTIAGVYGPGGQNPPGGGKLLHLHEQLYKPGGRLTVERVHVEFGHHRTEYPQHVDHIVEHMYDPTEGVRQLPVGSERYRLPPRPPSE